MAYYREVPWMYPSPYYLEVPWMYSSPYYLEVPWMYPSPYYLGGTLDVPPLPVLPGRYPG